MKKLLVSEMITLDGFFAGPNGEIDWHNVDDEFNVFAEEQLNSVDTLIFGRVTYELMASYWPTPAGLKDDPIIANIMNSLNKVVFSKTLKTVEWNNSRLATADLATEIQKLKEQPGKDMVIFGSGTIVSELAKLSLIDEYRLFINPVVLGKGKPLFQDLPERMNLQLIKSRQFKSGNVLLYYVPKPRS